MTRNQMAALNLKIQTFDFPRGRGATNLAGRRFGRLLVYGYGCKTTAGKHYWACGCDCGEWAMVERSALTIGQTTSCGCAQSEVTAKRNRETIVHGEADKTTEYRTWVGMKARCNNPNYPKWRLYGGRGIKVCDRWQNSYAAFLSDMGRRPPNKTSIDRIDPDGDYEPGNCRWADAFEQNRNRRPKQ